MLQPGRAISEKSMQIVIFSDQRFYEKSIQKCNFSQRKEPALGFELKAIRLNDLKAAALPIVSIIYRVLLYSIVSM